MVMLIFVLDLSSTYERKHATFVFLNLDEYGIWKPVEVTSRKGMG
jgi:hypothetical protein